MLSAVVAAALPVLYGIVFNKPWPARARIWWQCACACAETSGSIRWCLEDVSLPATRDLTNALPASANRLLVMLSGTHRGTSSSWSSLHKHLVKPLHADLMLVISATFHAAMARADKGASAQARSWLLDRARFVVPVPEYADWGEALDQMEWAALPEGAAARRQPTTWRARVAKLPCPWENNFGIVLNFSCVGSKKEVRDASLVGSGAIVATYRWAAKQFILKNGLLDRYDWFVFTRIETYMLCPMQLPAPLLVSGQSRRLVLVPHHQTYPAALTSPRNSMYDRFSLSSAESVIDYLTTMERIVTGELGQPSHAFYTKQPERVQRAALRASCVRVAAMPGTMFLSKAMGHQPGVNSDRSTWGHCNYVPTRWKPQLRHTGVCAKYLYELETANRSCALRAF